MLFKDYLLIAKLQEEDWGLKFDHAWSLCLFYVINENIDNFEFMFVEQHDFGCFWYIDQIFESLERSRPCV
jgi:hypothetical protein